MQEMTVSIKSVQMDHTRKNAIENYFGRIWVNAIRILEGLRIEANEKNANKNYATLTIPMKNHASKSLFGETYEIVEKTMMEKGERQMKQKIVCLIFARMKVVKMPFASILIRKTEILNVSIDVHKSLFKCYFPSNY